MVTLDEGGSLRTESGQLNKGFASQGVRISGFHCRRMCSNWISSFCNCVLSVHDEWVLAIISLPGILLSGTGHLHPDRDAEHSEDLIVRFLQRSNFTAKEEFGDSERASSTC